MAHNRAQLNALIFHNAVVLPRTSPGFAEVTLAVAELQGGNNAKAAFYAETAYRQDPTLAAAWLAKLAADVFEATPNDLRKERALFCMDRALESAPTCRREIIEFFVANILGHYVEVLCQGAVTELNRWLMLEACADEVEHRAMQLGVQATQMYARAALLEATSLVTGMVALFSRRLGTQIFSAVASVAAFSEASRVTRDAALLDGMANELRLEGRALRLEGREPRAASMLYLVPARDLIEVTARLLRAEGLPPQSLGRLTQAFSGSLRQVLDGQLQGIRRETGSSLQAAILGEAQGLEISYWGESKLVKSPEITKLYARFGPVNRGTLLWLEQMLPGVRSLEAYQLLASPLSFIAERVYGLRRGASERALAQRINKAHVRTASAALGCFAVLAIFSLFVFPPVALLFGALAVYRVVLNRRVRRRRKQVEALLASLWSADAWLRHPAVDLFNENRAVTGRGTNGLPSLAAGDGREAPSARITFADVKFIVLVGGAVGLMFLGLFALLVFGSISHPNSSPAETPGSPEASASPRISDAPRAPSPEICRGTAVRRPVAPSPSPATALAAASPAEPAYTVVGVAEGDTLNVRAGPGANTTIVAKLPNGTTHIGVTGAPAKNGTTEWVPIKFGDRTGWVTKQHLQRE